MINVRASTIAFAAAALLSPLGCAPGAGPDGADELNVGVAAEALTGPTVIANQSVSGLVESTGNLYWTRNYTIGFPRSYTAQVWRAAKTNTPGQETLLYQESNLNQVTFGSVTYAMISNVWYGFFVANYRLGGTLLKRVALDGSGGPYTFQYGANVVSAGSPLINDGWYLYYFGADGMYYTALVDGSGDRVADVTGITGFTVSGGYIYFAAGNTLYRCNRTAPNLLTTIAPMSSPMPAPTAAADPNNWAATGDIYFGSGGDVYLYSRTYNTLSLFAYPSNSLTQPVSVRSMSFDGYNILWTWTDGASKDYVASVAYSAQTSAPPATYLGTNTGARLVLGDSSYIFYGDNTAIKRFHR